MGTEARIFYWVCIGPGKFLEVCNTQHSLLKYEWVNKVAKSLIQNLVSLFIPCFMLQYFLIEVFLSSLFLCIYKTQALITTTKAWAEHIISHKAPSTTKAISHHFMTSLASVNWARRHKLKHFCLVVSIFNWNNDEKSLLNLPCHLLIYRICKLFYLFI